MSSQSIEQLLNQAVQYHQSGMVLEARAGFRKILKKVPAHADALYFVGLTYVHMQDYDKGIASIRQSIAIKPNNAQAHYSLGNIYSQIYQLQEAANAFSKAVNIKPDFWQAYINLGNMLNLLGRHEEAIPHYRNTLAIRADAAEALVGLGIANAGLKRFDEAATEYRQAISLRPEIPEAHFNLAGALAELKQFDDALVTFKQAIALRPNYQEAYAGMAQVHVELQQSDLAVAAYKTALTMTPHYPCAKGLGDLLSELDRHADAIHYYRIALSLQNSNASLHNALGVALSKVKRYKEAAASFKTALTLAPENFDMVFNLANALMELKQYEEAIIYYRAALALDPTFAEAHHGLGDACKEARRFDEALAAYNHTLKIDPDFGGTVFNRSLLNLTLGNFAEAWPDYQLRLKFMEATTQAVTSIPMWLGHEDIAGKQLYIQFEQGFGDALQMVRYLQLLERQNVECWLQCPLPLSQLIQRSFPRARLIKDTSVPETADFHVPIMSLPLAMRTFSEAEIPKAVPYLHADAALVSQWRAELATPLATSVGLIWRGNPGHKNDAIRSASLRDYLPLIIENRQVQFVSMQKDLSYEELELLQSQPNVRILDEVLTDFDVSAAVMQTLDLMITIDSAPAHLAGGLGIPVWLLLSHSFDWRWMVDRKDSPWYPTARLFRQDYLNNWAGVMGEVHASLQQLQASKNGEGRNE